MPVNDSLGDMLTRIRNAQMRRKSTVLTPSSKLRVWVLDVLQSEGYIRSYEVRERDPGKPEIEISLKYYDGAPVMKEIKRISKPGRRVYTDVRSMPSVRQGLGVAIISTAKGVMSDADAREQNVGGEVLCTIF